MTCKPFSAAEDSLKQQGSVKWDKIKGGWDVKVKYGLCGFMTKIHNRRRWGGDVTIPDLRKLRMATTRIRWLKCAIEFAAIHAFVPSRCSSRHGPGITHKPRPLSVVKQGYCIDAQGCSSMSILHWKPYHLKLMVLVWIKISMRATT